MSVGAPAYLARVIFSLRNMLIKMRVHTPVDEESTNVSETVVKSSERK